MVKLQHGKRVILDSRLEFRKLGIVPLCEDSRLLVGIWNLGFGIWVLVMIWVVHIPKSDRSFRTEKSCRVSLFHSKIDG